MADLHELRRPGAATTVRARAAVQALRKGLLKVMSKMGIATISSYCGAQIFEAVGLDRDLVDRYFAGTPSAVGGVGLDELAAARRSSATPAPTPSAHGRSLPEHVEDSLLPAAHADLLPQGGVYAWRRDGERHTWDPETIAGLQRAAHGQRRRRRPSATTSSPSASTRRTRARADPRPARMRKPGPDPARGGRAGDGDRQALHDRRR